MASLFPIISLLLVIVISLMVVRIATVALVLTGLSHQLAQFQARSAFTGAGFTTSESDKVTQHPVRRRIIMLLMLLGNAGIVTAVSSLMLSFVGNGSEGGGGSWWLRGVTLIGGVAALWFVSQSVWVDKTINRLVEWALRRWTDLEIRDYSNLLHLSHGYMVVEMVVEPDDWLTQKDLGSLRLSEEGVLVLGVERTTGPYLGAPRGDTHLQAGDVVILYGPNEVLANLDEREAGAGGNWDHHRAVDKQLKTQAEQKKEDAEATAATAS